MYDTDDAPAGEPDDQHTSPAREASDSRLRTFRTGADQPFLVLSDERRTDPSPVDDGDTAT